MQIMTGYRTCQTKASPESITWDVHCIKKCRAAALNICHTTPLPGPVRVEMLAPGVKARRDVIEVDHSLHDFSSGCLKVVSQTRASLVYIYS